MNLDKKLCHFNEWQTREFSETMKNTVMITKSKTSTLSKTKRKRFFNFSVNYSMETKKMENRGSLKKLLHVKLQTINQSNSNFGYCQSTGLQGAVFSRNKLS